MTEVAGQIVPTAIEEEMKRSYLDYSMSVIVSRALPDVRDGLKPVQRRIIFSMDELGVRHDKPHKKTARLVGETMGKYHPHGELAIYDSLVRLAQPFNIRYPLVDGHGNFGSIDGDEPAAMRYTEARLSAIAEELLADIDKDTVDFVPNFDDTLKEPVVLPSKIPNLLINGASGIAVGMATNIPPHNLREVVDALVAMINNPDITNRELMEYVQGPDFPTAGIIVGKEAIRSLYETGRGILSVRARAVIEREKGGKQQIVVDELPYQVNKARLIERIAELVRDKKVQGVIDLRDESDKRGMRIVIEVRKDVDAEVVLRQLYKHTDLETSFGGIMLALVNGRPQVLDLRGMLWHYLQHRREVVVRRTRFELRKAEERAHILAGIAVALQNLDAVIALIRAAATPQDAKEGLMREFGLDEVQARAILEIRLERLTRLEIDKVLEERKALLKEIEYLRAVLASDKMVLGIIQKELEEVKERYGDDRRTRIVEAEDKVGEEELIIEEEVSVILTRAGYIKRMPLTVYRSQRRGGTGAVAVQTRDEDWVEKAVSTTTKEWLLLFTTEGKAYWLRVFDVPEAGKQAKGHQISKLVPLAEGEKVTALIPVRAPYDGDLFFVTSSGTCKRTALKEFVPPKKAGVRALTLSEGDSLILAKLVREDSEVFIATSGGRALRMKVSDVRRMGRSAAGVRGIKLAPEDKVVSADPVVPDGMVFTVTAYGYGKRTPLEEFPLHKRGGRGILVTKLTEKGGPLAVMRVVPPKGEAILLTAQGVALRLKLSQVKVAHRGAQGVRLMKLEEGDRVAACSILEGE